MKQQELWEAVYGVTPPYCNHSRRNMITVAESGTKFDTHYELIECHKCGVRKQYRISLAGTRKLLRAVAIRRVA